MREVLDKIIETLAKFSEIAAMQQEQINTLELKVALLEMELNCLQKEKHDKERAEGI